MRQKRELTKMLQKILNIIFIIINKFFNKHETAIKEKKDNIEIRKAEIVFETEIENIAKQAESENKKIKQDAIEKMRKLISEK